MKKLLVKVVAVLTAFCIVYTMCGLGDIVADASQLDEAEKLTLSDKIEFEKKNNTTLLDEYTEKKLNDEGLFDSDINNFDIDTISNLYTDGEYYVDVRYYKITDVDNENEDSENEVSTSTSNPTDNKEIETTAGPTENAKVIQNTSEPVVNDNVDKEISDENSNDIAENKTDNEPISNDSEEVIPEDANELLENAGVDMSGYDAVELTDEETNSLINEKYATEVLGDDTEENEKSSDSILKKIGKFIGIVPDDASAKTSSDVNDDNSYVKMILMVSQSSSSTNPYVYYSAEWLKMPFFRNWDAIAIQCVKNCTIKSGTLRGGYIVYYDELNTLNDIDRSTSYEYPLTSKNTSNTRYYYELSDSCDSSIGLAVHLNCDYSWSDTLGIWKEKFTYTGYKIYAGMYVTIDNKKDWEYINLKSHYYHQQADVTSKPSISISSDGVSVDGVLGSELVMNKEGSNTLTYYFK